MKKDILAPVNTTQSSSPSIKHAAEEPKNWRAQGQPDVNAALKEDPRKNPMCPAKVKE